MRTGRSRDSAEAARNLGEAAVHTAQADLGAKRALEQQADANVADARAKVQVASAVLEKARVYVSYTQVRSPYNGVVTKRDFHVGDFVRAAEEGGQIPVLTVAETDVMRVVVKVPEDYVPLTRPGDLATFKLTYTDHVFQGKVARIADSLDRDDKTMRTEIDLPNPANELRDGMFGYATIELSKSLKGLSVPSSSVVNNGLSKTPAVFRCARRTAAPNSGQGHDRYRNSCRSSFGTAAGRLGRRAPDRGSHRGSGRARSRSCRLKQQAGKNGSLID